MRAARYIEFYSARWTWSLLAAVIIGGTATAAPAAEEYQLTDEGLRKVAEPDLNTPEGQLHPIRQAIAAEEYGDAIGLVNKWVKKYPNHPMRAEAYLLRANAKAGQKNYYKALFDYEYVIRAFPGSPQFNEALEQEFKIAEAFGNKVKRKLWGMRILPAAGEAEELLIRIQERAPGSALAERAGIELADFYFRRSEMGLAAEAYGLFLENYPESQWREHALLRQIQANLATFKGPRFDATGLMEARERLETFDRQYPASSEQVGGRALMTRIDASLADKALEVAQWYDQRDMRVSATYMYSRVIRDDPKSAAAHTALERLRTLDPDLFRERRQDMPAAEAVPGESVDGPAPGEATEPE